MWWVLVQTRPAQRIRLPQLTRLSAVFMRLAAAPSTCRQVVIRCPRRSLSCWAAFTCRVLVANRPSSLRTLAQGRSRRRRLSTRAPGSPRVLARTIC
nr:MAG TPA: hypothetical protein [Caudoviricetes sp.]